mmetsp:Transcript_8636/g.27089  ORF Transcript_8636/g.27089 Transcript_8636/m.27089 type:complete len:235 (-) Transcript_8636:109-813(-)
MPAVAAMTSLGAGSAASPLSEATNAKRAAAQGSPAANRSSSIPAATIESPLDGGGASRRCVSQSRRTDKSTHFDARPKHAPRSNASKSPLCVTTTARDTQCVVKSCVVGFSVTTLDCTFCSQTCGCASRRVVFDDVANLRWAHTERGRATPRPTVRLNARAKLTAMSSRLRTTALCTRILPCDDATNPNDWAPRIEVTWPIARSMSTAFGTSSPTSSKPKLPHIAARSVVVACA